MRSFLAPLFRTDGAPAALVRRRDGAVLARALEAAVESSTRRRGLLGRDGLADGAGLVIAPCNAIHTFFMRFAIDVVFVRRDGAVVKVVRDVAPFRLAFAASAFATIELAAGTTDAIALTAGDVLDVA